MLQPFYIDTHAHLNSEEYSENIESVLDRAEEAGVNIIIIPGIDVKSSQIAVQLADRYSNIYASVGIHPHESAKHTYADLMAIEDISDHPKVVAIGEIGLDYHYDFSPRDRQKEIFTAQLEIAVKRNLPVVIHTRKSNEDCFEIVCRSIESYPNWRKDSVEKKRGVFHCFPGNADEAVYLSNLGFYVSYPGIVTFKKTESVDVIKNIGIERMLLETDSPYMSPVPHRGKRNEPANIVYIGRKIAEILNIPESEVARITSKNAIDLFNIKVHENKLLP